ncbi:MAG: PAS-domain containing protein [Pseudomonadota bacterium]
MPNIGPSTLVDPDDPPERRAEKLMRINEALMRRVERATDDSGAAYAHFQKAVVLDEQVRERTRDLEKTLSLLSQSNAQLAAASEAEQRARADLSNALEAVQEGFALFGPDDRMVMCNTRFCRLMPDVWRELREGISFDDYVELISRSAYLDDPRDTVDGDPKGWADRRRRLHLNDHVNFNVRLRDDIWLQVSEHRTPHGGTAIIQTDITDMIRLERAERDKLLDAQTRMVRATLDHISQGVCIFDSETRLVGWNRRLGTLLAPPMNVVRLGIRFKTLFDAIAGTLEFDETMPASAIHEWVNSPSPRSPISFELRRTGDMIMSVSAQETPEQGFVISFTDITVERKAIHALFDANEMLELRVRERTLELEDALGDAERANASKSRFVAAASHDLLQPLSAAKLFVSSLSDMQLGDMPTEIARRAQNALGSVENILGALLDISKLDSGQAVVDRSVINLGHLLRQLEEEFTPIAAARGLKLRFARRDATVDSDPALLRRILQNLVANAIRYTDEGGVLVGVRQRGTGIRVDVFDTGPGIPEDKRDDIFREFRRLDAAGSAAEGMGLGLTIVDKACGLLGHDLALSSVVGRGTRFSVSLPGTAFHEVQTLPHSAAPRTFRGSDLLVLIIEDDPEFSEALGLLLETWGMARFIVGSGAEALSLLRETDVIPDIILADYALGPDETGPDAIAAIRAQYGPVPAGIITASRDSEVNSRCREENLPLMRKPIEATHLLDFIARAV